MKSVITVLTTFLLISCAQFVFAEDKKTDEGQTFKGTISVTPVVTDISGSKATFNQYGDIPDGFSVKTDIDATYETERYYVDGHAGDMGYDTQNYRLEGGRWGVGKAYFSYDELPHNFTEDARSFYTGIGTNRLTFPTWPPGTNVNTWNTFDYSLERKKAGGGVNIDVLKPFFFKVDASTEEKTGVYPLGAAGGDSPSTISLELPVHLDYTTNMVKVEAGYSRNPLFLSFSYCYGSFDDDSNTFSFRNPTNANTAAATDVLTLPPDNTYYKLDFTGAVRLPLRTKFNIDLSTSRASSETRLLDYYINNGATFTGGINPITLSSPIFNGKVDTNNYAFALTSNPVSFLDAKISYKYYDRKNKSDQITTTEGAEELVNDLFSYNKSSTGAELGFRLPLKLYLSGSYAYTRTDRNRDDVSRNDDQLYGMGVRWSGADFMTARVRYERLYRTAEFESTESIDPWFKRFDTAPQKRDAVKVLFDFFPTDDLDFSFGFNYKHADYNDSILGVRDTDGNEFTVDASYLIGKRIRLYGDFEYERDKRHLLARQMPFSSPLYDPSAPSTAANFNWTVLETDESYQYSLGAEVFIIPQKLTLKLQHNYVKSNGALDFTYLIDQSVLASPALGGRTQDNIDIGNWDNYSLQHYLAQLTYQATKALSCSLGYAYERFKCSDAQYDGYQYVPATSGNNGAYLTGAYSDPSYETHLVYMSAAYKF